MKPYEHIKHFTIKYCDCDFRDEMKTSVALALMEEVACSSADELGFGYAYVQPRGYAFMVTNICMEFLTPVRLGETVALKTWPLPPTRATFGREYQVLNADGEICINASSRWCLVDMQAGKLLPSKVIDNQDYSTYNTHRVFEDVVWKIPTFLPNEAELRYSMTVASSDYDHNMHVNNTRYADYCLNCFTIEELSVRKMKRFSITYAKQCKEGDELRFYRKRTEKGAYLIQGFNAHGETVVQALIYFEE
jgi:acyl-CoA thioesterase FadM